MIARLKGLVAEINDDGVIVDVNGVGYFVLTSTRTIMQLNNVGEPVHFYTELLIRNELPCLVGFENATEQKCFQQLMTVQGVGARVALAILSVLTPEELLLAIYNQDKTMVARADGVGPKLAARIVNELKDKKMITGLGDVNPLQVSNNHNHAISDSLSALENLGYKRFEASAAVQAAVDKHGSSATTAILLKAALASLSQQAIGKTP